MIESSLKIVTHGGGAHLDDYLAVGLLYYKLKQNGYNNIEVIRKDLNEDELENVNYVVDMGLKYDGVKYFDHHHDINLECSLFLVAKHIDEKLYITMKNNPEFIFLDIKDRFGFKEAMELYEKDYKSYAKMLELVLVGEQDDQEKESPYYHVGKSLCDYLHKKIGKKEKERMYNENIKCVESNGLKICYIDEILDMPSLAFRLFRCDLLLYRSARNKDLVQILKNENRKSLNHIDLSKLCYELDVNFVHLGGFIASIRHPNSIDTTLCNQIADVLTKENEYVNNNSISSLHLANV